MGQPLKTEKSGGVVRWWKRKEKAWQCCWATVEEYVTVGVEIASVGPIKKESSSEHFDGDLCV